MGRAALPLSAEPEVKKELPCAWCGERSRTVCGRCKARAYCGAECQRLDWKSGHQTACILRTVSDAPSESSFQFYEVPYVARWAINLERWDLEVESREFSFLLDQLPDDGIRHRIRETKPWSSCKIALAKELAVRRLAEIMTQAVWSKVRWHHDEETDRDFLVDREHYVWTGQKYQNANLRFPNFNFSIAENGEYLFVASHPVALTGIYAATPVSEAMPDPREEFAEELAGRKEGDERMLSDEELMEVCSPETADLRRHRLRQALVGKFAYRRTLGQAEAQWSQIVLGQQEVGASTAGDCHGEEGNRNAPRQFPLQVCGKLQKRWRCDVHSWRDHCIVVCRGPPDEVIDGKGNFNRSLAAKYLEIDVMDLALDHMEPGFIEVPIQQLLPEKWHSDYVRACGGGEKGEQVRMNYSGRNLPDIPKV